MSIYPAFPFVPVVSILKRKGEKRRYAPFGMIEPKFRQNAISFRVRTIFHQIIPTALLAAAIDYFARFNKPHQNSRGTVPSCDQPKSQVQVEQWW